MTTAALCQNCLFWTGNRTQPKSGVCRRFPPQPGGLVQMESIMSQHGQTGILWGSPETKGDFGCGEFRPAGESTPVVLAS